MCPVWNLYGHCRKEQPNGKKIENIHPTLNRRHRDDRAASTVVSLLKRVSGESCSDGRCSSAAKFGQHQSTCCQATWWKCSRSPIARPASAISSRHSKRTVACRQRSLQKSCRQSGRYSNSRRARSLMARSRSAFLPTRWSSLNPQSEIEDDTTASGKPGGPCRGVTGLLVGLLPTARRKCAERSL